MKPRILFVYGTRPEIIKLSPLIRLCVSSRQNFTQIHSGQHYSPTMDAVFMRELGIPRPEHRLRGRSAAGRHGEHVGRLMTQIELILERRRPTHVVVQGDTNTVLAASLAAAKIPDIRVAHVEAGLRSFDRRMPEEINRVAADHVSDLLFAPTQDCARQLRSEGIPAAKIRVTGNTIVDAVRQNLKIAERRAAPEARRVRAAGPYGLLTLHRQENVDDRRTLRNILTGLSRVIRHSRLPIYFPAHPRTVGRLQKFGLRLPTGIHLMPPTGYFDFLHLQQGASLILTDSGGVQEESCILRVPCVTLRESTERPETVRVGGNIIAGCDPDQILRAAKQMLARPRRWSNPFGDGEASQRILKTLLQDSKTMLGAR